MDTHTPPKPFYIFVSSYQHGMAHGGMSAFSFAEAADRNNLDYVVYYLDRPGWRQSGQVHFMTRQPEVVSENFNGGKDQLLVRQSFPWTHMVQDSGFDEHVLFICHALKLPCAPHGLQASWDRMHPPQKVIHAEGMLIHPPSSDSSDSDKRGISARKLRDAQAPAHANETDAILV
jgi:hypothetical protein